LRPDRPRHFEPIHLRHLVVQDHQVVRRRGGRAHALQRRRPALDFLAGHPPRPQLLPQDLPVRPVVVHHQHPPPSPVRPQHPAPPPRAPLPPPPPLRHPPRVPYLAPPPPLALHPDRAPHHPRHLLGDRQPQPRPPVLPRRRAVRLRERLEQPLPRRRRDADPR